MPTPWPGENTILTGGFLLCYSVSFMYCICIKIRSIHLLIELLRSPRNFDSILGLYRTGKLHLSQGVSGGTIHPFHLLSRDRSCSPRSDDCCENYANCALFCLNACHLVAVVLNSIALYLYSHFKFRTTVIMHLLVNKKVSTLSLISMRTWQQLH